MPGGQRGRKRQGGRSDESRLGSGGWRWTLTPAANRNLERLSEEVQRRIHAELNLLVAGSPTVDIRKLEGGNDEYRLRVGDYRVLYGVDKTENVFVVFKIADRKEAYR